MRSAALAWSIVVLLLLASNAHGQSLDSVVGVWRGRVCSVCGCPGAARTAYEAASNVTITPSEVVISRARRRVCGEERAPGSVSHAVRVVEDSCVHFVSGSDAVKYTVELRNGMLHLAYAPELAYCPAIPYTPRGACTSHGETRAGFYGIYVPIHAEFNPPECFHDADQMTLANPLAYMIKVLIALALVSTLVEAFTYRYLLDR